MVKRLLLCAGISACLCLTPPVCAQDGLGGLLENTDPGAQMQQILTGKTIPLSISISDLQEGWQQFTIDGAQDDSNWLITMMRYENDEEEAVAPPVYYTNGLTVTSGGQTYLVTYQQEMEADHERFAADDFDRDLPSWNQEANKRFATLIEPDTKLSLALLNLSAAGNLLNIRPFVLKDELATSAKARYAIQKAATRARLQSSIDYLGALGNQIRYFSQSHKGKLPAMSSIDSLCEVIGYYPGDYSEYGQADESMVYKTNTRLSGKRLATFKKTPWVVLVYEAQVASNGTRGVLFVDARAKRVGEAEWVKLKKANRIP